MLIANRRNSICKNTLTKKIISLFKNIVVCDTVEKGGVY